MRQVMRFSALFLAVVLAGCTSNHPADPQRAATDPAIVKGPATTLRVLAGSELADMRPILDEAAKATGVTVTMDFTGSLEGAETVATGKADGKYDAVWFSSDRYLESLPDAKKRLGTATRIMGSPVVLGLRPAAVARLGWTGRTVSWKEIAAAAAAGRLSYAMTDPSASNTGFSALVEVASALDGSGKALDQPAIDKVATPLTGFFQGQKLTAGSSGWLTDAFVKQPLDGLINYESSLVELNHSGKLAEPLTLIYPTDGVVSADYPLTLLAGASTQARDAHELLGDYLRTVTVQQNIGVQTFRRPAVPGVARPAGLPQPPVELPFPETRVQIDALLTTYQDRLRRPSRTVYVLDTSGSMKGARIASLKSALAGLTGVTTSLTGNYCRFRSREEVTLLPFSDRPHTPQSFTVDAANPQPSRDKIRAAAGALTVGGNTAVYDSLVAAYQKLDAAADKNRFVSIVLMTDGESNKGKDLTAFKAYLASRGKNAESVAVFPILFGEAAVPQMQQISTVTGGEVTDARGGDLTKAFCSIRGYQ